MSMMHTHEVERAFARMTVAYGREFLQRFEGQDLEKIKAGWVFELKGYSLDAIAWAAAHLPPRAPNLPEFQALCAKAPRPQQMPMKADTSPVRGPTPAERAKLEELKAMYPARSQRSEA